MVDQWAEDMREMVQDLFDLTANRKIKMVVEGELGDIIGTMYFVDPIDKKWTMIAVADLCETVDEAIRELVKRATEIDALPSTREGA